jgi:hypothetical protein
MSLDVSLHKVRPSEIYSDNITHNLTKMAMAADIYYPIWKPQEVGIVYAHQLIPILEEGYRKLCDNPEEYEKWNPENGWGNYVTLKVFVRDYLKACRADPDAKVRASC